MLPRMLRVNLKSHYPIYLKVLSAVREWLSRDGIGYQEEVDPRDGKVGCLYVEFEGSS